MLLYNFGNKKAVLNLKKKIYILIQICDETSVLSEHFSAFSF